MREVMHNGPQGLKIFLTLHGNPKYHWEMRWNFPSIRKANGPGKSKADCIRRALDACDQWAEEINSLVDGGEAEDDCVPH